MTTSAEPGYPIGPQPLMIKIDFSSIFNFLLFSFLCLKINRYSDFGNDAPSHIYYFFLTSLALDYYKNITKIKMGEIITLSAYLVFNKITFKNFVNNFFQTYDG